MLAHECGFPGCREEPGENGMCQLHRAVTVSGSYVDDHHSEGGHG